MPLRVGMGGQLRHGGDHIRLRPLDQCHLTIGGVVLVAHTGGERLFPFLQGTQDTACHVHMPQYAFEHVLRDSAGTQDARRTARHVQDSGFHADIAAAAVKNQRDAPVHIHQHMMRRGRAGLAGAIRAGGGNRQLAGAQERRRNRVRRHPHGDGRQTGGNFIRNGGLARQNQRQRPRPESVHQLFRQRGHLTQGRQLRAVVDVDNQRIIRRTPLRGEDIQHGFCIEGVRTQSVHRFGRKGDKLPVVEQLRRKREGFGGGGENLGHNIPSFLIRNAELEPSFPDKHAGKV